MQCPICRNIHGGECATEASSGDWLGFQCQICGRFRITRSAFEDYFENSHDWLSPIQHIALAHRIRTSRASPVPVISTYWIEHARGELLLPTPAQQATNAIRYIGERQRSNGTKLDRLPIDFFTIIGAPSPEMAGEIVRELGLRGQLTATESSAMGRPTDFLSVNLSLSGWESYELEQRGKSAGSLGFIAMKFGDVALDRLVAEVLKPGIQSAIGYRVVDLRDVSQAGLIDNILRAQIRDSAFVLVDLTHDNSGAYWEAGYAEGLGKPVIYLCERSKFDAAKTHFDTNHSTTVIWEEDAEASFLEQLVATVRRSLNLFDG